MTISLKQNFSSFLIVIFLKPTESLHVKKKLTHRLHVVQSFGITKSEESKDLLTPDQYSNCLNKGGKRTWYTFILEAFTQFIYKVCILTHAKPQDTFIFNQVV